MDIVNEITKVNEAIVELIKSSDAKWKAQHSNLKCLLLLQCFLLKEHDCNHPTLLTLRKLDNIKDWRTENLNTKENMDDLFYREKIAEAMCLVKLEMMSKVLTPQLVNVLINLLSINLISQMFFFISWNSSRWDFSHAQM